MNDDCMKHGAFGWVELCTTDSAAAKAFYSALFGWECEKYDSPDVDYTLVKVDGDETAGIMTMPAECQGMPPAWGVYITVDDVDVTVARVAELGGKVLRPPTDIPNVGRFCVIQDPQGAVICAMTYAVCDE